jgi:hypothetical protein
MTNMPIGHPFESASRLGRTAAPATPRPTCSRVGATFAQDVVAAVDIGVKNRSITCAVPTARHALAGKHRLLNTISLIGGQRVVVQERCLAGIALFLQHHLDPNQSGFVGQLIDKARMRNLYELLIGARA